MIIDKKFLEEVREFQLNNPSEREEENLALKILANIPNSIECSYLSDDVELELSVIRILERYGVTKNNRVDRPESFQRLLFITTQEFNKVLSEAQNSGNFGQAVTVGLTNLVVSKKTRELPENVKYTMVHLDFKGLSCKEFVDNITQVCPDYIDSEAGTFFRTAEDIERDRLKRREQLEQEILRQLDGYKVIDLQSRLQEIRDRVIRNEGVSADDVLNFSKLAEDLVNRKEYKDPNCVFTCLHPELMEEDSTLIRMYTSLLAEINYLYGKRIFVHSGIEDSVARYYNEIRLGDESTLASDRIMFYENLPQVGIYENPITPTFYKLNKVQVELDMKYISMEELVTKDKTLSMKTVRIPSSSIEIISKPKVRKKSYESSMGPFCELINKLDCITNHVDLTKLLTYTLKGSSTTYVGVLEDIKVTAEVILLPVRIANPDAPLKQQVPVNNNDYSANVQVLNKKMVKKLYPLDFTTNGVELFQNYLAFEATSLQKMPANEVVKRKMQFTQELYKAFTTRSYHKTLCEFSYVFSLGGVRKYAVEQNSYIYDVTVGLFYGSEHVVREAKRIIGEYVDTTKLGLSPYGGINPKDETEETLGDSTKGTVIEITENVIRRHFN